MRRRDVVSYAMTAGMVIAVSPLFAQSADSYTARLSWVPISGAERDAVAGHGSATATLSGSRLSVTGSFEELPAPVTDVRLHQGVATGARGPVIEDLAVTGAESGTFEGDIELTAEQLAALRAGYVYIQVHAEKGVPEDNSVLWGWLLADEVAR